MSPSWRDVRDSNPSISALTTQRGPKPSHVPSRWSRRVDSNNYITRVWAALLCQSGIRRGGAAGEIRTRTVGALNAVSLPGLEYRGMVLPDGFEPPPHRLRAER